VLTHLLYVYNTILPSISYTINQAEEDSGVLGDIVDSSKPSEYVPLQSERHTRVLYRKTHLQSCIQPSQRIVNNVDLRLGSLEYRLILDSLPTDLSLRTGF